MSANNVVKITISHKGTEYRVSCVDADTDGEIDYIGNYLTKEEAIGAANEYIKKEQEEGYGVEYGVCIGS